MAKDLSDVAHWFGGDLIASNTGDLARVARSERSRQRVLRRLLTAEGDYIAHPDYGSGIPQRIGDNLDLGEVKGAILGQMAREASVARAPEPAIALREIANGVRAHIGYTTAPDRIPAVLAFDADADA